MHRKELYDGVHILSFGSFKKKMSLCIGKNIAFAPRNVFEQCCPWKTGTILSNKPFKQVFLGLLSPQKFHKTGKFPLPHENSHCLQFLRAESPFHCIYCRVLMWSHYKYATEFLLFCWYKNLFLVSILDISYCMCLITSASQDFLSIG